MKVHNVRSPEQREIISRHVDFEDKTVIDLGCGKGDILFRAFEAGAQVTGIDRDAENIRYIQEINPKIKAEEGDLNLLNMRDFDKVPVIAPRYNVPEFINFLDMSEPVDIIICFSVFPYLDNPEGLLEWINRHSNIAFIECQYAGDGPGFSFLTSNDDMKYWLGLWGKFKKAEVVGHTIVEGRDKNRFIWMCE